MSQQPDSVVDRSEASGAAAVGRSRRIVRPVERPHAALRLFRYSHAGVGASAFRGWAEMVPHEVGLCAVQLPDRGAALRESCVTTIADAVGGVLSGLEGLPDRPFALLGHSTGALLAFETARQLAHDGGPMPLTCGGIPRLVLQEPELLDLMLSVSAAGRQESAR